MVPLICTTILYCTHTYSYVLEASKRIHPYVFSLLFSQLSLNNNCLGIIAFHCQDARIALIWGIMKEIRARKTKIPCK